MSVFRVEKNKEYTVMAKYHLKEKEMSLKAKGLLSLMLSLPDDWDYTIEGLISICKESETAIKSILSELKEFGYLEIKKIQNEKGQFEYQYNIYEKPEGKKPEVENPPVDNPAVDKPEVENQGQLNTNILSTNKLNNKDNNIKHKYGEDKNVLLKDDEIEKLKSEYTNWNDLITYLDEYIEMKGYKAKSHYLCIKKWVVDAIKKTKKISEINSRANFEQRQYDDLSHLYANKEE